MKILQNLKEDLDNLADAEKAKDLARFFKTGKGEYGEGDVFLGIKVPDSRKVAKKYFKELNFVDLQELLDSEIHDHRFVALIILVLKFEKTKDEKERKELFDFYIKNSRRVNNWDLVDTSTPQVVGGFLKDKTKKEREILYQLVKSENLWERRISILATYAFIRNNDFEDTLKIAEILLNDNHDLIHKAVGWMLREVGNRNQAIEEEFLKKHYQKMPRIMLRYAIEKFEENLRQKYLKGMM